MTCGSETSKNLGIYIHIPFCQRKCPYCDFYSIIPDKGIMDVYLNALKDEIVHGERLHGFLTEDVFSRTVDTLYFGGGTPSFFGDERIGGLINLLKNRFNLAENAEITVECNPSSCSQKLFAEFAACGVNRISMGLQSACDKERQALGRLSGTDRVKASVLQAKAAGIENISLDLMLGVPESSLESLKRSLDFCFELDVPHISAYMLKVEEGTPFARGESLNLPGEDELCEMYLYLCGELSARGLEQYEISNFARAGFESRHNLKYWNCDEYLGIGPAAHSFIDKKRFYFERDISAFIGGEKAVFDSIGGSFEEYLMLRLRLSEGVSSAETQKRFSHPLPDAMLKKAVRLEKAGMLKTDNNSICLTPKGFMISNEIIKELVFSI